MFTAAAALSIVLALISVLSAVGKLGRAAPVFDNLSRAGVPTRLFPVLAALLLAGAAGLVVGLWEAAIGIAAAACLTLYFIGAVAAHVRAKDDAFVPPLSLALMAGLALVLRVAAA